MNHEIHGPAPARPPCPGWLRSRPGPRLKSLLRAVPATTALLSLAGCATFSSDGGMSRVSQLTQERTGHPVAFQRDQSDTETAHARVATLLEAPLTPDTAVEVALLANRSLQQQLGALGVSEADLVEAGRLRNPAVSLGRIAGGGTWEVDRSAMFDLLGLLTLQSRSRIAQARFEQAQLRAAAAAVAVAEQARRAYFEAVAAQQLEAYANEVMAAADASGDLAKEMVRVGNLSHLDQMRERAFLAESTAQLARWHQRALATRERLVRALGIGNDEHRLRLPERLPDLPREAGAPADAERAALDLRLDVQIARQDTEATARALGLTQATGFINVLDAGWQDKSQTGAPTARGGEVQFELPIFDFGGAGRARAQAIYLQAVDHAAAALLDARSEVREAYAGYRTAFDLARHYRDEVVPLHKRISDETMLRYNGMLVDVFELLADARDQVASVTTSIEATRDFWLADTRLQETLAGVSPQPRGDGPSPLPREPQ